MPAVFVNGQERSYPRGTTYENIVAEFQPEYENHIALVYFNGKMRELSKKLERDGAINLITTKDPAGHAAYARTAIMMLVRAWQEVTQDMPAPHASLKVEFTLGNAYFISVIGQTKVTDELIQKLNETMHALQEKNLPIVKKTYPLDDAIALFHHQGMTDKEKLFRYRNSSTINVYCLDGYYDYYYGYMLPSTGYVKHFEVTAYKEGMLLNIPEADRPDELQPLQNEEKIYDQLMLSTRWGELVNISTVGDLNDRICEGNISDMILVQEALQERRIGNIAEEIHSRKDVRFVLIAGPSSSGKTTFAHRLSIQLRSFGMHPHIMSMDNWFVNRDKTPVDIDGNYNYDVLEAVDLDLFNENLTDLLAGEEVELPTFDFKVGHRKYDGNKMKLGPDDILIIEGIHGLNPKSTVAIPNENKYRIYTSALTSLNIDAHNRIPTSDTRLLRRIVRDYRTRAKTAKMTIREWAKVRDGEEKYIFPFQNNVDAVFNSVLIYEQAVLKQFAEPLLYSITKDDPEYYEAKRLLKFLDYFVGVDTAMVPANSICREFVGGGCFPV